MTSWKEQISVNGAGSGEPVKRSPVKLMKMRATTVVSRTRQLRMQLGLETGNDSYLLLKQTRVERFVFGTKEGRVVCGCVIERCGSCRHVKQVVRILFFATCYCTIAFLFLASMYA